MTDRIEAADYKSIAVKLAAFCARLHGRSPADFTRDEIFNIQGEAIKLAHEFKAVERRLNHKPIKNYEKV